MEWVRFIFAAICILFSIVMEIISIIGTYRFKFIMNRMHAAAIADTMALGLMAIGLIIIKGFSMFSLKMILVVGFLWLGSSIASHVIMRMELNIDEDRVAIECEVQE